MDSSDSNQKFGEINRNFDWLKIARLMLLSRSMDLIEEQRLYPEKKITYQFSSRGHELIQALLGSLVCRPGDGLGCYYRSRPLVMSQGLTAEESFASSLALTGSMTEGREIGVVGNLPARGKGTVLPTAGDVGSQYTPAVGWAEAILYYHRVLGDERFANAMAVVQGGEGSVASNGFWSALTIATTIGLPLLFFIEDNGYAISVPSYKQTPGGNIAQNLQSFSNLWVFEADGTDPDGASNVIFEAVKFVRSHLGPALLRLSVPRLSGHSGQDTQAYKSADKIESELARDPIIALRDYLVPVFMPEEQWEGLVNQARMEAEKAVDAALLHPQPLPSEAGRFVFLERNIDGEPILQLAGGAAGISPEFRPRVIDAEELQTPAETTRINMTEGIRRTLSHEMERNPRMVIFGEDVGKKGGVHTITQGLQDKFGPDRVFDTSLSEEGIVGRAVGMALAGMLPVPEIQFRKYADAGMEQITNCGSLRWRTANKFAAPIIIRLPGGVSRKGGDPWHSMSAESILAHLVGWNVAMPATIADAVGLLRTALRSQNPTLFFEHRALLDAPASRGIYPGDEYTLPFGSARLVTEGDAATIVTWGAMVETSLQAIAQLGSSGIQTGIDLIDLRTISPWDRAAVLASVRKTKRCLIVHEDTVTAGFGAEIAAVIAEHAFSDLDAPVMRVATPDAPVPYNRGLMEALIPGTEIVAEKLRQLLAF